MVGWHHQLNGHVFVQAAGDSEGQGSLEYFSPWSHRFGHDLATEKQCKRNVGEVSSVCCGL